MKNTGLSEAKTEVAAIAPEQKREWISRGNPDCVHYWIGTGVRSGGAERFACRYCGAVMAEPLNLTPVRRVAAPVLPGFSGCDVCGSNFHWSRTVRNPITGWGRICLTCLEACV